MAVNEVIYGGETLISLTDSTVTPATLLAGATAYAANGDKITGQYTTPIATASALGAVIVGTNISVDGTGKISVANGSTSTKGVVQLTNSTSSTSTTTAATPASVKSAYDLANGKQSPATTLSGYGITNAYTKSETQSNFVEGVSVTDANAVYDGKVYMIRGGANCPSGSQYGVILGMPYRKLAGNTIPDFGAQIFIPNGDDATKPNAMFYRTSIGSNWNAWQEVATLSNVYTKAEVDSLTGESSTMKNVGSERTRASGKPNYGL